MQIIQTIDEAFEVFIGIVNLHNQKTIQRYLGQQSNLGELPNYGS